MEKENRLKISFKPRTGLNCASFTKSIIVGGRRTVVSSMHWRVSHSFERQTDITSVHVDRGVSLTKSKIRTLSRICQGVCACTGKVWWLKRWWYQMSQHWQVWWGCCTLYHLQSLVYAACSWQHGWQSGFHRSASLVQSSQSWEKNKNVVRKISVELYDICTRYSKHKEILSSTFHPLLHHLYYFGSHKLKAAALH